MEPHSSEAIVILVILTVLGPHDFRSSPGSDNRHGGRHVSKVPIGNMTNLLDRLVGADWRPCDKDIVIDQSL